MKPNPVKMSRESSEFNDKHTIWPSKVTPSVYPQSAQGNSIQMFTQWQKRETILCIYKQKNINGQTSGSVFSSKNELELHILTSINLKTMLSKKEDSK